MLVVRPAEVVQQLVVDGVRVGAAAVRLQQHVKPAPLHEHRWLERGPGYQARVRGLDLSHLEVVVALEWIAELRWSEYKVVGVM